MTRVFYGLIAVGCSTLIASGSELPHGFPDKLKVQAAKLFEQADENHNGALDPTELPAGFSRAEKVIESFIKDHTVHHGSKPWPTVPEPILANKNKMNESEFTLHLMALASRMDANLRTREKIKRLPPIINQIGQPLQPTGTGKQPSVSVVQQQTIVIEQVFQAADAQPQFRPFSAVPMGVTAGVNPGLFEHNREQPNVRSEPRSESKQEERRTEKPEHNEKQEHNERPGHKREGK